MAGGSFRNKVSSIICEELGEEPLILGVERSQLGWFGHSLRMPPGHLPVEGLKARRRRTRGPG